MIEWNNSLSTHLNMWQDLVWRNSAHKRQLTELIFDWISNGFPDHYFFNTFLATTKALEDDREAIEEIVEVTCKEELGDLPNSKQENLKLHDFLGSSSSFINRQ